MSHVTTGEGCITDLDALETAVKSMGGTLVRGQRTYKWYGKFLNDSAEGRASVKAGFNPEDFGKCEHAIRIPGHQQGTYEVGVVKRPDGKGLTLQYDGWSAGGRAIVQHFGQKCGMLKTEYTVAALRRAYRGKRIEVTRKDGKARVRIHA